MEHSLRLIKTWATNPTLITLRKLKASQASFPTTIQLEINKEKTAKNTNTWRLNNMLLNNQWITEEIKKYLEANGNKDITI